MGIGGLHGLQAHQRADQHEQGGFGQVEIGHQAVDRAELVARRDEDVGVALERADDAVCAGRAFQQAEAGGADGDDPAAGGAGAVQAVGGGGVDPAPFAVHPVVVGLVDLDRQEGAGADVQGQGLAADPRCVQRLQQGIGKVQRRGGRGDGALFAGKHRLIVAGVALVDRPLAGDIGRQRHGAGAFEQQLDRLVAEKAQDETAVVELCFRLRRNILAEIDGLADAQPFGVADEGLPAAQVDALVQGRTDAGVAAGAGQLRRNDPGIVEDQYVVGAEQARQVADQMVGQPVAGDLQQLRAVARHRRSQRYALRREVKVEKINAHRPG